MTNSIYFFRHGESVANAGGVTVDNASIDLTQKGVEQAKSLARFFTEPPHQVISSPYLRARKTAENALAAYPGVTIDTWPIIREFSYLSLREGTTMKERLPLVKEYWDKANPDYRDGSEVETFRDFISRVDAVRVEICSLLEQKKSVAFFGHGIFMNALRWRTSNDLDDITNASMRSCREYDLNTPIANGAGFRCQLAADSLQFYDLRMENA